MNLLSIHEIASRLDNRFTLLTAGRRTALPQHQTLRAAIEWSHDLLGHAEKILFRRLSVFTDSFSLQAAEAVCGDSGISQYQVLDLLGRLVDKSLLQVDPGPSDLDLATRYRFLDSIVSFSRLKLAEAQETSSLRDRHSAYYADFVESIEPKLLMQDQGRWYKLLQAEGGNIRTVIEWGVEQGKAEDALRLVGALLWFWWSHGSMHESEELSQKALAIPAESREEKYRGRALVTAGYSQWVSGNVVLARQRSEEALTILRKGGDPGSLARSLHFRGLVFISEGGYDQADQAMQEGLAIAEELGDSFHSTFPLAFQGDIAFQQGIYGKARQIYEESASLRGLGNHLFEAYPQRRLGYLGLAENNIAEAHAHFHKSLQLNQEGIEQRSILASLLALANLAVQLSSPLLAALLMG